MIKQLLILSAIVLLLQGCSIGKGYIVEPGIDKCIGAYVDSGSINVETLMGPSVNITGSGIRWHSIDNDKCDGSYHGKPGQAPSPVTDLKQLPT